MVSSVEVSDLEVSGKVVISGSVNGVVVRRGSGSGVVRDMVNGSDVVSVALTVVVSTVSTVD